jgi:hypothetical protein
MNIISQRIIKEHFQGERGEVRHVASGRGDCWQSKTGTESVIQHELSADSKLKSNKKLLNLLRKAQRALAIPA